MRRIVNFPVIPEVISEDTAPTETLNAYIVGGRDVLRTWEQARSPVAVLLPDEDGWSARATRILADEISFINQVIRLLLF